MMAPVYIVLCVVLLLMTLGRVVFRAAPKGIDWALEVAFIRLDFPPAQRLVAQQLAAGLAEIVGMKIKQLRPEHNFEPDRRVDRQSHLRQGFDYSLRGCIQRALRSQYDFSRFSRKGCGKKPNTTARAWR